LNGEYVVDTSVIVDAIVAEARRHSYARKQLAGLSKVVVPSIAVYELVWVLNKLGVKADAVRGAVESITGNPKVVVFPDDGRLAARAITRVVEEKAGLSNFDDKVILETALRAGLPLLTFDSELRKESDRAGLPSGREPGRTKE